MCTLTILANPYIETFENLLTYCLIIHPAGSRRGYELDSRKKIQALRAILNITCQVLRVDFFPQRVAFSHVRSNRGVTSIARRFLLHSDALELEAR